MIIIDSGWPTVAHEVLQRSIGVLKDYLAGHHLITLSKEDARHFIREHPENIGKDPIILITDTHPKQARRQPDEALKGIRIDLGEVHERSEVVKHLQQICRLITRDDFIADVSWEERRRIAKSFLRDVVRDVLVKFLELIV